MARDRFWFNGAVVVDSLTGAKLPRLQVRDGAHLAWSFAQLQPRGGRLTLLDVFETADGLFWDYGRIKD